MAQEWDDHTRSTAVTPGSHFGQAYSQLQWQKTMNMKALHTHTQTAAAFHSAHGRRNCERQHGIACNTCSVGVFALEDAPPKTDGDEVAWHRSCSWLATMIWKESTAA